ncbi:MAG: response regulator [Deltaproteobacteria bacterium]|nr:MAG: response regulator [Deltaproteobacteria bacterium]
MQKTVEILLIDDETEFTSTLAERLSLRGYDTRTAEDGETGIRMILEHPADIIILDLMMPGLSGLETLKQLKSIHPEIPMILLTGHGSTKEGMEGMRLGAYDYLMKPLDIHELTEKIAAALKGQTP